MVKEFLVKLEADIDDYAKTEPEFETTGRRFMTHLASYYWGIRGFAENFTDASAFPLFIAMDVSSSVGSDLASRIWLPFSAKPLYATISDLMPIGYYKKRWLLTGLACAGMMFSSLLAFSSHEQLGGRAADVAYLYYLGIIMCVAAGDSLTQGKYSEVCRAKGSSVVSFTYGSKVGAGMAGVVLGGFINQWNPQVSVMCVIPCFLQLVPVAALNFMGDARRQVPCKPDFELAVAQGSTFVYGQCIVVIALMTTFFKQIALFLRGFSSATPYDELSKAEKADVSHFLAFLRIGIGLSLLAVLVLFVAERVMDVRIARINIYLWGCAVLRMYFSYQLQQWYTAPARRCPDAPHFPTSIYQSVGNLMSGMAQLFAIWLFEVYVVHWKAPFAFWVTTFATMVGSLFDIVQITRTNVWLLSGTPLSTWSYDFGGEDRVRADDLALFLFGTQAIRSIVETLDSLPSTLLLSKLCPKNMEATTFAILAALQNLGSSFAGQISALYLGSYDFEMSGMYKSKEEGGTHLGSNFEDVEMGVLRCFLGTDGYLGMNGLNWALFAGGVVLPGLTIPATWAFIPDIRLDEDFIDPVEDTEMATGLQGQGRAPEGQGPLGGRGNSTLGLDGAKYNSGLSLGGGLHLRSGSRLLM